MGVEPASVVITGVKDSGTGGRRLLASSIEVTTVISVPEEAATSMLTDFNSEGVVTSLQSSTGFIAEAPIAPEVVITIAPTPPYIPGVYYPTNSCAVGMSKTTWLEMLKEATSNTLVTLTGKEYSVVCHADLPFQT